jgi:hypothetical protein
MTSVAQAFSEHIDELTTPEQLSVALTLAFARCAPEVWRETGATDEELHAVSEDVLRQLRQRQLEEATPDDEDRGLVWPAPKIVRRGRVVWDDAQPAQRPTEEPQQSEGDERPLQAQHQPDIEKARSIICQDVDCFHTGGRHTGLCEALTVAIATALRAEREAGARDERTAAERDGSLTSND